MFLTHASLIFKKLIDKNKSVSICLQTNQNKFEEDNNNNISRLY